VVGSFGGEQVGEVVVAPREDRLFGREVAEGERHPQEVGADQLSLAVVGALEQDNGVLGAVMAGPQAPVLGEDVGGLEGVRAGLGGL
jgi:hypothetical protein